MGNAETARQRRLARAILVTIASSVVVFVLFASGPSLGLSLAQQPSPSTSSPSPTQTTQYQVEFLNPSGTNFSKIISDDEDSDESYHLVAWVNQLPPSPTVEFRWKFGNNPEQVIGTATQSNIPDSFHFFWDIENNVPEEEDITLIAVLFSGGTEVDRDTTTTFINRDDPEEFDPTDPGPPDTSAFANETVEILYPQMGGSWGLFTPRSRATAGIFQVDISGDASHVRAVYTVTAPGNEPQWTDCGTETVAAAANGLRCTLSAAHRGTQVTAIGAVANTSGTGNSYSKSFDESADAHRVVHYEQVPATIELSPANQDSVQTNQCSAVITATIKDDQNVPLPAANLDVHAQGPADEIAFDSNGSAAPTGGGHTSEQARNCSANPPSAAGSQGDHNLPGNDTKHVETTASGTSDAGTWTFRLFSPSVGTTQYTVFSDLDDDDIFCSSEVSANGAVGFGQSSGGITGLSSETSSCPSPSPTSPDPGPSTPTPDPTDTGEPDPRGCTVSGTQGSEELEGTDGDDIICAYGGNDIIIGKGGNDVIYGDDGRDDIRGGAGDDEITGGSQKDTIRGAGGDDELLGEDDNDVLVGGGGADLLEGGDGFDTIRGGGGSDIGNGNTGDDIVTGGNGPDDLRGGPGDDSMAGNAGRDRCIGGGGRDTLKTCEDGRS